jgi:crotonobetainyl-CoA:carnitine CoA-transferase CaiB-like acyl-CoA transferase
MLQEQMRLQSTQHWITCLEDAGIPCGPINTYADVLADQQVKFRELTFQHERADASTYPAVRSPLRLSKILVEYLRPPPALGQHTGEVLTQALNLTPEPLQALGVSL